MMAAGGSVEPFWELYAVHKQKSVLDILESYRIGNLDENDQIEIDTSDPFGGDPKRHPALQPRSKKPFNAEPPPELLVEKFVTPKYVNPVR